MAETDVALPSEPIAGRYQLTELIHLGSMSRVFRAQDTESAQIVAVKRPVKDHPGSLARFLEEAQIHRGLLHPAIVRQLGHGGTSFVDAHIVMEWLEGQTLEQRLASGPLGLFDAVTIARRAAEALSLVHREQVVHRDLKPANLLLCDGAPAKTKLIDFGIARRESARGLSVHATFAGGTWAYMSPEQAMGSAELGARTDVYSLGCVLFEAISGSPAFPSDRARAVVAKVWQPAPNLADFCEDVPAPLVRLLAKMLATDPSQRPKDGSALVSELVALGKLPTAPAKRRS